MDHVELYVRMATPLIPSIISLPNYPQDGKHLMIDLPRNFPFLITKGEDWNHGKRKYWCVYGRTNARNNDFQYAKEWFGELPTSYHLSPEKAYAKAVKEARVVAERYLSRLPNSA